MDEPVAEETMEGSVTPPHPEGSVNAMIEPLYDGTNGTLSYDASGPSSWTLPVSASDVDTASSTFWVSADQLGATGGAAPGEFVGYDEVNDAYQVQSWPVTGMLDNGDGTVTLSVDIGPYAA